MRNEININSNVDHIKCLLGEGPVWDELSRQLLWVDILKGDIHAFNPETNDLKTFHTGQMAGAIALCRNGGIIAALQHGFARIDMEQQMINSLIDPEAHLPGNRFNDGKCDPAGRFWAGTMSLTDEPGAGNLYTLETDQDVSKKEEGISCSNGLAWSIDETLFYHIDSPLRKVHVFDYEQQTGRISNKRVAIEIPENDGIPDGMTIDAEGMLWIALWDGAQIQRWDPVNGLLLSRIRLPVSRPTSCTFGGAGLTDLYITSASVGIDPELLNDQPLAGKLLVIKNAGKGLPASRYAG